MGCAGTIPGVEHRPANLTVRHTAMEQEPQHADIGLKTGHDDAYTLQCHRFGRAQRSQSAHANDPCLPRKNTATFAFNAFASYVVELSAPCNTFLRTSVGISCQTLRIAAPRQAITRRSASSRMPGSNTATDIGSCTPLH